MNSDDLKRSLIDRNPKMDSDIVSMPRDEFWRFYRLVWVEAQKELLKGVGGPSCAVVDDILGMWGGKR